MKIGSINSAEDKRKNIVLKGKRVFQNTVKQLAKNNKYSLTEPNQRLIRNAITELGKVKGSKNIEFLMNTAAQSTYSTNIELQDKPKNNWKEMLLSAAAAAVALTTGIAQNEFIEKIANLGKKAPLTKEEQEIMGLRDQLLNKVDLKQIKADTSGTMKDFKKNLDSNAYFSSLPLFIQESIKQSSADISSEEELRKCAENIMQNYSSL